MPSRSISSQWCAVGAVAFALTFIAAPMADAAVTFRSYLDQYTGTWRGAYTVKTFHGKPIKTITVEQTYWWDGEEQRGVAVFDDNGSLSYEQFRIYVEKNKLRMEVSYGEATKRLYTARFDLERDAIIWTPENLVDAVGEEIRERLVDSNGELELHTVGYQTVRIGDDEAIIQLVGMLRKLPEKSEG